MPESRAPRRQERGLRRMTQLLDAAAEVLGEVGYEAATTNAIAARAGVSPGTLYQFFRNKEAMVEALAERYATELARAQDTAFGPDILELPLTGQVERIVETMLEFNLAHPGYKALFETRPDMPERLVGPTRALHDQFMVRLDEVLANGLPRLAAADRRRGAEVTVHIFRAMVPLVATAEGAERAAVVGELKRAVTAYVESLAG